ncbi:hypothetical protein [Alteromonas mediterranea]|uniref:hypothetical protein n=1 Tax=Alteromonas mediterranea TaxID=314275 RepID=UPI0012F7858F|nr:hypothetical protein [Alteromonas mediterranea]QGX61700.1 hypothetical protein FJN15_08050 [Alteromonas mediterranea]
MIDAVCTYGEERKIYNILSFQELSDSDIEKLRQYLQCPNPKCEGEAFYRKKSKDGKAACFGSRYHVEGCGEGRSSKQFEREVRHSREVNEILTHSKEVHFEFFTSDLNLSTTSNPIRNVRAKPRDNNDSKLHSDSTAACINNKLDMEKALNSLMRGSDLGDSEAKILIDDKYHYKAKNLFVNFANAEAADSSRSAKPKMFWGTISHTDSEIEWLNPADCDDIGIPIRRHRDNLLKRFKITEKRDVEGAGIILFGKCFWNSQKNRKIIEPWSIERIYISLEED